MVAAINAPIAFVDTETTSLREDRDVWEVAVVRREPDGSKSGFCSMIDVELSDADPASLSVGGFYSRHPWGRYLAGLEEEDPRTGPKLRSRHEAASRVARATHGAHLVGVNPAFDAYGLTTLMLGAGVVPGWHYHMVDVGNLALAYAAANDVSAGIPWSSDALFESIGVNTAGIDRHTALGDAILAERVFDHCMGVEQ